MIHRRRGVFLVEMLTVLLLLGMGGTLLAVAFGSMLRSQQRVVAFSNQFAQVNDFLGCLSRDVRRSTTASLLDGDGGKLRRVLVLGTPPRSISYRFYERQVERMGSADGPWAGKLWNPMAAEVGVITSPSGAAQTAVNVTVHWHRTGAKDPEPNCRFDVVVRCAGEVVGDDE